MKIAINNNGDVYTINNNNKIEPLNNSLIKDSIKLDLIDKCLKPKSMIMVNKKTGDIVFETTEIYPQHFYPLTILDYANAIKEGMKSDIDNLPILSISTKDYPFCDFNCKECLADPTRMWAVKNIDKCILEIEEYKKILKEIARYSKKRGCNSVRLEICGEGNPDLYINRADLIKFAKEECNMGIVYISTGSKLNEKTLEAIVKYGAYIRISLPGISWEAYDFYSNQRGKEKFTYEDAIKLLEKICNLRKQFNRERELMVGVRTCIRQKNEGHYLELSKLLGQMGVDSFQMVKVLTDNIIDKKDIELSDCTQKDLLLLDREYKNLGLKHIQTPKLLDKLYINRDFLKNKKPTKCFSSIVSPILYGNSLIVCIHWDKIRDKQNAYYGVLSGKEFELEEIMQGKKAQKIRKRYPMECNNCCALNDNLMLEVIRSNLALFNDVDIIDFMLVY